ncbi:ubiquitin carboxyl-terminal hydrolase 47-like isoform X2 [Cetorhinus maximus]
MVLSMECSECTTLVEDDCSFLDLPLSIRSAESSSKIEHLDLALQEFLKQRKMDGDNACYCDKCGKKTEIETRYYFKQLPQILTLHLKRFEVATHGVYYQKLHDDISIPLTLNFNRSEDNCNEWCLKPTIPEEKFSHNRQEQNSTNTEIELENIGSTQQEKKYELFAIWHHIGEYGSGHYYAEIKSGDDWYDFNDCHVVKHGSSEILFLKNAFEKKQCLLRSNTAYLIMYKRKESKEKIAHNKSERSQIGGKVPELRVLALYEERVAELAS